MAGAWLACSRWRVLAWAYAVNLLLAVVAGIPAALSVSEILDHSFEARRLVKGFDLGAFVALLMHPEVSLGGPAAGSLLVSLVYLAFMLFLTGGMLHDFRQEQRLSIGEFCAACGAFFWRFARLFLFLLIVLVPLGILYGLLADGAGKLAANSPQEKLGFWLALGCTALALLLFVAIRLWFDVAQVRAVAEDERKIRCALRRSFRQTFPNFLPLLWFFLVTGVVACLGSAAAVWLWVKYIRPEDLAFSILLGQVIVLLWIATRLWLRACETLWYQRRFPPPVVFAEPPSAPPVTLEMPSAEVSPPSGPPEGS